MADWVLVIPVKRLAVAKTRLAPLAHEVRHRLALAFATDTIVAARAASHVRGIAVVTDDPAAAEVAMAHGCLVVPDEPDAGINPALQHGAAAALVQWPGAGVAALSSDLPALRSRELADALRAAEGHDAAFVADVEGTGTTLLTASGRSQFHPSFGPSSAAAHGLAGAVPLDGLDLPSLRRDVDTEADLSAAIDLGVGPHTRAVLAALAPGAGASRGQA